MRTSRRGLARILVSSILLVAELALCGPASGQGQGGGKPTPPPDIPRPICFQVSGTAGKYWSHLKRADASGTSIISVNHNIFGHGLHGAWPRWSPDGQMIGCYRKWSVRDADWDDNFACLMVMSPDGTNEQVVMTGARFNAWNLSRPGVLASEYELLGFDCWLGTGAFVFAGKTTYDTSFFGDPPGGIVIATRLFIVDAAGTITPLTEAPPAPSRTGTSEADRNPHWSPALNKIVFTRNESVAFNLYAINPDGTGLVRITDFQPVFDAKMDHAVWNPAGDRIAVCGAYYPGTYGNRLWVLDVDLSQPNPGTGDGGRVTRVQPIERPDNAWDTTPSWSPDGRLVFKHGRSGEPSQILILDLETGGRSIVASGAWVNGPDWDPTDLP